MLRWEMLKMDQVAAIRHAVLVMKRSRRWAARTFGVARGTVDRYLDDGAQAGKRKSSVRPSPQRHRAEKALADIIAETAVAKKQQLTAKRAHELLEARGVVVGYSLVKELMAERRRASKEVFVPLEYPPGDLGEVDFFEVVVELAGEQVTAWAFVMRLMCSGRDFCWLYPRQDQVCFLDGHRRAFEFFGAVPRRCAYDNLKAAVSQILVGSERKLAARFEAMTTHYTVEASFCRPRTGHDKGGVEARGKNIRLQSMVPVPSGTSLDDVSTGVLADMERRFKKKPDGEARWAAELQAMHVLPSTPFEARRVDIHVPVSASATVNVEGAVYSVPAKWSRGHVEVRAGVHDIEFARGSERVCRRRIPKGESDIDYAAHYLEVLATKPQAVRQVADTLVGQLGAPFPDFWGQLNDDNGPRDAARKMARILQGIVELGREECIRRVERALRDGEAISTALLVACSTVEQTTSVPPALNIPVESSSVDGFDALLSMGGAA